MAPDAVPNRPGRRGLLAEAPEHGLEPRPAGQPLGRDFEALGQRRPSNVDLEIAEVRLWIEASGVRGLGDPGVDRRAARELAAKPRQPSRQHQLGVNRLGHLFVVDRRRAGLRPMRAAAALDERTAEEGHPALHREAPARQPGPGFLGCEQIPLLAELVRRRRHLFGRGETVAGARTLHADEPLANLGRQLSPVAPELRRQPYVVQRYCRAPTLNATWSSSLFTLASAAPLREGGFGSWTAEKPDCCVLGHFGHRIRPEPRSRSGAALHMRAERSYRRFAPTACSRSAESAFTIPEPAFTISGIRTGSWHAARDRCFSASNQLRTTLIQTTDRPGTRPRRKSSTGMHWIPEIRSRSRPP